MKKLKLEEAITTLQDMKVDIPVPKAAVMQTKRNVALDMAIDALNCSEIPNNCPAADVVPVVHGVWRNGYRVQTCSVCKGTGKKSWKFCPYCGAKMDGERKEKGQNGGND